MVVNTEGVPFTWPVKRVLKQRGWTRAGQSHDGSIYLTREEGTETQILDSRVVAVLCSIYLTREEGTETSHGRGWLGRAGRSIYLTREEGTETWDYSHIRRRAREFHLLDPWRGYWNQRRGRACHHEV